MSVGHLDVIQPPVAADGKPFVLPNIFPGEVMLSFAGIDDAVNPTSRFSGTLFGLQKTGVGSESQILNFVDGIFLAGGNVSWEGGSYGSSVTFELVVSGSTVKEPAVAGQGNCNLVPVGQGINIIVPAAGNGAKDLDAQVPIPAYNDETNEQTGYWNYSEPWIGSGSMTPTSGAGKYNLFDFPITLAKFAKLHIMRDSDSRDLIAPAIKPKWILPEWKLKVSINNVDANKTLKISFDLLVARRKSA